MRTVAEMKLIQDKAYELAKLLSKDTPVNSGQDPTVKGVIELIIDELRISKQQKAVYLYKAMKKYM